MRRAPPALIGIALALFTIFGCATIFNDKTARVSIRTEPQGIKASTTNAGKQLTCVTDCFFELNSDEDHVIRFEDPDIFTTQRTVTSSVSGWFYANLLIGLPGVVLTGIDWATDSMYSLSHDEVFVEFLDDEASTEEADAEDVARDDDDSDQAIDKSPAGGTTGPTAAQPFTLEQMPTGVAALPDPTPEDREQIERVLPPSRIASAIRNYYGELDDAERAQVRDRIYRILQNQQVTSGQIDLDQAIVVETHDRLR